MKILVACEESQIVTTELRKLGHEAFSNDIQETSGNNPEWHLQMDVFKAINLDQWELMIAFPPCTHLACAGGVHFEKKRNSGEQKKAIEFVFKLMTSKIEKIAIENPVGILSSDWYIKMHFPDLLIKYPMLNMPRKPDQIIQPYYFGDKKRKYTCLWLKNLQKLTWTRTNNLFEQSTLVTPEEPKYTMIRKGAYRTGTTRKIYWQECLSKKDRGKIKSKTFPGIAKAMATQWPE